MSDRVQIEDRSPPDADEQLETRPGWATAMIGLVINLGTTGLIGCMWLPIFFLPAGTGIRPMSQLMYSILNAVLNLVVGCVCGIVAIIQGRNDDGVVGLGGFSFLLGLLLPVGVPWLVVTLAGKFHGIWLEP
jgi:hypothetical protein